MFLKLLTVAGFATFEIYVAIPAGFAFGLHPYSIFLASVVGGLSGVFIATFLGDKIRAFFHRKKPSAAEEKQKHPILIKIWNKYGLIGLGLIGTFSVGAPISIAIGTGMNANLKKLLVWCCVAVIARCTVFTVIGHYGLQLF